MEQEQEDTLTFVEALTVLVAGGISRMKTILVVLTIWTVAGFVFGVLVGHVIRWGRGE